MTPHEITHPHLQPGLSARTEDGFTIATVSGDFDIACAPMLREGLLSVLGPQASRLIIDLSNVSFCDASGLAVLVGTDRRARLLGGVLRLAAPAPSVGKALCLTGLGRQFDIFSSVRAAITNSPGGRWVPNRMRTRVPEPGAARTGSAVRKKTAAPDADDLRGAVTALLAHSNAWRDADPNRRLTLALRALARAHAGSDRTALLEAARSLLAAVIRHPLTYSPAVAGTATDLRRVIDSSSHRPALN